MKTPKRQFVLSFILPVFFLAACSQHGGLDIPVEGGAVAALVNQHRISNGLPTLEWSHDVYLFAQIHADDMASMGGVSHTNSSGEDLAVRMTASGIVYTTYGESLALGFPNADAVAAGWIASPDDLNKIENPAFTKQGVGYNSNGDYWCHVFIGN